MSLPSLNMMLALYLQCLPFGMLCNFFLIAGPNVLGKWNGCKQELAHVVVVRCREGESSRVFNWVSVFK